MFAQINHVAMCSPNWPMLARFYEAVFGLQASEKRKSRPISGANIGDGYVGLKINPLRDGYVGGLDHFGMAVDDVEEVMDGRAQKFPNANIVKRPSTRPFAAYSAHDPDGNVFDLAQKKKRKLDGVYADQADQDGESRAPTATSTSLRSARSTRRSAPNSTWRCSSSSRSTRRPRRRAITSPTAA